MEESLDKKDQYNESTSSIAKWIGEVTNLSPMKINYLLDQYSGGIGDVILPMTTPKAETGLDNGELGVFGKILTALPSAFVDKFVTDPDFKNQNITDFYTLQSETYKASQKDNATDETKISNILLTTIKKQMSEKYAQIRDIYNSDLSDKEKYYQAKQIQKEIGELAKYGLDNFDNMDIKTNYAETSGIGMYKNKDGEWVKLDEDTQADLDRLNMTTDQKSEYITMKDTISKNNQISTLIGYYNKVDEINNSSLTSEVKAKELAELQEKIADAESKFTATELANIKNMDSYNAKELNYNVIQSSNLTDEQKNYVYDKYYSSTTGDNINNLDIDDKTKLELKYKVSTATGIKGANGNTVSNSKALQVANYYAQAGVLDEVFDYIKDNGLEPSSMGLSNTLFKMSYSQIASMYEKMYGEKFGNGEEVELNGDTDDSTGSSSRGSSSGSSKSNKMRKALLAFIQAIRKNDKYLEDMDVTTIEDAKKAVEDILKNL